jgi:hypothetical protein
MDKNGKIQTRKVARGGDVRLPRVMIEESDLSKGNIDIYYGGNYTCAVIVPAGTKLGAIQRERVTKLISEPLSQER